MAPAWLRPADNATVKARAYAATRDRRVRKRDRAAIAPAAAATSSAPLATRAMSVPDAPLWAVAAGRVSGFGACSGCGCSGHVGGPGITRCAGGGALDGRDAASAGAVVVATVAPTSTATSERSARLRHERVYDMVQLLEVDAA